MLLDVAEVLWTPGDTRASETPHGSSWMQGQRAGVFSVGRAGLPRVTGQRGKESQWVLGGNLWWQRPVRERWGEEAGNRSSSREAFAVF